MGYYYSIQKKRLLLLPAAVLCITMRDALRGFTCCRTRTPPTCAFQEHHHHQHNPVFFQKQKPKQSKLSSQEETKNATMVKLAFLLASGNECLCA